MRAPADGAGAALWARVAALEGQALGAGNALVRVVMVDDWGLRVGRGSAAVGPETRLSRRVLEEAAPFVEAGEPLPPRFRARAARLTAILRAAGVGPGA